MTAEQTQTEKTETAVAFMQGYFRENPHIARYILDSAEIGFRPPDWSPSVKMVYLRANDVRNSMQKMPAERTTVILDIAETALAQVDLPSNDVNLLGVQIT